ncbi:DUF3850 domain-containing protein [Listeria booriae]|uniref:DUF3850 domain-containing protein n=1 Tax=Listeria booriae TaxID=1552123 RepID=UPI0016283D34|nr:DUF3850 domain-containing protein [Listeria booriae]MBC1522663.1 DUF3850 domain-containing protein [Listeria booriae]
MKMFGQTVGRSIKRLPIARTSMLCVLVFYGFVFSVYYFAKGFAYIVDWNKIDVIAKAPDAFTIQVAFYILLTPLFIFLIFQLIFKGFKKGYDLLEDICFILSLSLVCTKWMIYPYFLNSVEILIVSVVLVLYVWGVIPLISFWLNKWGRYKERRQEYPVHKDMGKWCYPVRMDRGKMVHDLKIAPKHYTEILWDNKRFETRVNDRDYHVGDRLILREWDTEYTGRVTYVAITFMTTALQRENYVCLGFDYLFSVTSAFPYIEDNKMEKEV